MLRITFCAAALSVLFATPAFAQDSALPGDFTANITLASEYVFRGITRSDENPVVQAGFDYTHPSGVYAGIWASNVDFNEDETMVDGASIEVDLYAGYQLPLTHTLSANVGAIYYAYPGADSNLNYDFWELMTALTYEDQMLSATASVNYSPDYFGGSDTGVYYKLDVGIPVPQIENLSVVGHIGHQSIEDRAAFGSPSYQDWSAGLVYALYGFDLALRYHDTGLSKSECADGCDVRVVFSVSRTF